MIVTAFPNGSSDKEATCSAGDAGDMGLTLGREDALEKEMAMHSSILVWRIPWTEEPARLQSLGLQRLRHDCATEHAHTWLDCFVEAYPF